MFILGLNDVDVLFMMMMLMMLFIVQMFIVQIQMMFILGLCRGILSSKFRKKTYKYSFLPIQIGGLVVHLVGLNGSITSNLNK